MTMQETAQAEAKELIEKFSSFPVDWGLPVKNTHAKHCALVANEEFIKMRIQPIEYYQILKQAIIDFE
jgi:hypothetical protein